MEQGARDSGVVPALFVQALELSPELRLEFPYDSGISPETRDELVVPLDADRASETSLQRTGESRLTALGVGERSGASQTTSIPGQDGMGVVFSAERVDGEFQQMVAIKVVQHARFEPRSLDPFRDERQLLVGPHLRRSRDDTKAQST
jgi:hypothetical protein